MNSSHYGQVTTELLSAYIDDAVTTSERRLVEAAIAQDAEIAWRFETLQHTVKLLNDLPELQTARTFVLTEALLAETQTATRDNVAAPVAPKKAESPSASERTGLWQALQDFFHAGSPLLRNFAASSMAAFLILSVLGATVGSPTASQAPVRLQEPQIETQVAMGSSAENGATARGVEQPVNVQNSPTAMSEGSLTSPPSARKSNDEAITEEAVADNAAASTVDAAATTGLNMADSVPEIGLAAAAAPAEESAITGFAAPESGAANGDIAAASVTAADAMSADGAAEEIGAAEIMPAEFAAAADLEADVPLNAPSAAGVTESATESSTQSGMEGAAQDATAAESAAESSSIDTELPASEPALMAAEAVGADAEPLQAEASAVQTTEDRRSNIWYVEMIALGLAAIFTVLWLISRRNYAPAI